MAMKKSGSSPDPSASKLISEKIAGFGDWRGKTLGRMRQLIREADPDVVEEWKWMGTPVWSHDGIICTGETYKQVVKLTFIKGASLNDPAHLFNASLDGNARRAIDIREGEQVDPAAFKRLVRQAAAFNTGETAGEKEIHKEKETLIIRSLFPFCAAIIAHGKPARWSGICNKERSVRALSCLSQRFGQSREVFI